MGTKSWRDLKLRQRQSPVGEAVPIVRCDQHVIDGRPIHINLTFAGDIYLSGDEWEENFRDILSPVYLLAPKLIFKDVRRISERLEPMPASNGKLIDLGEVATAVPTDPWQDGASNDTLSDLLQIRRNDRLFRFKNIAFDIRALVQLDGRRSRSTETGRETLCYPSLVRIRINGSGRYLHLLCGVIFPSPDGSEVGGFRLRYADDDVQVVPLIYGKHVRDGWYDSQEGEEASGLVWQGTPSDFTPYKLPPRFGGLKVYYVRLELSKPREHIRSIEFYSSANNPENLQFASGPFLLAATLE
jgi:hypothetical protein